MFTSSAVPSRVSLFISILRLNLVLTHEIPPALCTGKNPRFLTILSSEIGENGRSIAILPLSPKHQTCTLYYTTNTYKLYIDTCINIYHTVHAYINWLTRDGTAEPVSRDHISGANGDRENFIFLVALTHEQD